MPHSEHLPFEFQIIPETTGIYLRQLTHADFDRLFLVASDPAIWEQHPDRLRYTPEGFHRFFEAAIKPDSATYLVFQSKGSELMGSSRYYRIDLHRGSTYIGYTFLARKFWGGHWNNQLKLCMLDQAFRKFNVVFFEAGAENLRSVAALHKLGASEIPHESPEKRLFEIKKQYWPEIRRNLMAKINSQNNLIQGT